MPARDVIVIGGGAVGCAAAYYLAEAGVSVTLLERDDLAQHASGAAAGMLAPICESTGAGPFFELALRSLRMFPELAPRLLELSGVDPQYEPSGVLRVAATETEAAHLREQAARLAEYGLQYLTPEQARAREPHLGAAVAGALLSPLEGHVYSPALTRAYAGAAARLGAEIRTGVTVTGLLRAGDRVHGVITAEGPLEAERVLLCAGAWSRFCAEWLGLALPVEPVRGQILALDQPPGGMRSIVWDEDVYLVPKRDGGVVAGATEEHAGFDCRNTGAGVSRLLRAATRLLPALAESTFRLAWAGLRPDTPDHLPLLGPLPGVEGVTLAAGHFRNGVLLSPVTGRLLAQSITESAWPSGYEPFLPGRFLAEATSGS